MFSTALVCAILLVACGPHEAQSGAEGETAGETALEHARKHLDPTYVCPMHPQIVKGEPGKCPICGMDLVARQAEVPAAQAPTVTLSPSVIQHMGVRTARVARADLSREIRTQGTVTYDEERVLRVHPRTAGWIETLYVRTEGVRVKRGDDLADYFSPLALMEQAEYLAKREKDELSSFAGEGQADPADKVRLYAGRDLLRYLNVPDMYLMRIEDSGKPVALLPIMAPQGGIVTEIGAREGAYADPSVAIFTIVDLSQVWVMVDVFEQQIGWVKPGLKAQVTTAAYPERSWSGVVDFIYPEVNPRTRTLRARLELTNPEETLLPNMFVEVVIRGEPREGVLVVPRDAVIITGERVAVVKVLGDGRFQPVEVRAGMRQGDSVEILSGLDEGDEVVVSGQFLIDSEASLQASFRRIGQ